MQMPYVPHEVVVSHILPRLPVRSLLRYSCVCKAWRDVITDAGSFHRAYLRFQKTSMLVAPRIEMMDRDRYNCYNYWVTTAGFYRFEMCTQDAATILIDNPSFSPANEKVNLHAHCDGLVLLSAGSKVRVLNPATRRFLTLPWSTHSVKPNGLLKHHQALGLGCDPSSNTYKVARFFHRSESDYYQYDIGMEVFTIGAEHRWRETKVQPLYPVVPQQTATFFKGSLIWTIEESFHAVAPGFLCFSLEDESFSVMPPPPSWRPNLDYMVSSLAELHGELCLCVPPRSWSHNGSMEIWISNDLGNSADTQWERRYILANVPRSIRLIGLFDEAIVFQAEPYNLWVYNPPHGVFKCVISIEDLKFHDPDNDATVQYPGEILHDCDAIPYVPSLVPL